MESDQPTQQKPLGFLILGTIVGATLGLIGFKLLHNVGLVAFASVAGAVAGLGIERLSNRSSPGQPPSQTGAERR